MHALILSNRRNVALASSKDKARFEFLARVVKHAGLFADFRFVDTEEEFRSCLSLSRPDIVFPTSYFVAPSAGRTEGKIELCRLLEEIAIPYVGSPPDVLRLVLSKVALKDRWRERGVLTPEYYGVSCSAAIDDILSLAIEFPYIVKPANEGNSRGIDSGSVVFSRRELRNKMVSLTASYGEVLVEKYLGDDPGMREFTVAALGSGGASLFMSAEIRLERAAAPEAGPRVVTTRDKDSGAARALPVEEPGLRTELTLLAARACAAAGVRDYARCDIIRSRGSCYAIEINGEPMVPDPWFEACASGAGLGEGRYLIAIFFAALCRLERSGWKGADRIPFGAMRVALPRSVYRALRGDT